MKENIRKNFKYILLFLFIVVLALPKIVSAEGPANKKVIVLILDEMSLEDMENPLIYTGSHGEKPGLALMNTKAKSSVNNRGSSYLSLGMGTRTLASTQGGLAFDRNYPYSFYDYNKLELTSSAQDLYRLYTGSPAKSGDILNIAIEDIRRVAKDVSPNNEVGLLGRLARENQLKIAALGNSDITSPNREFTMLAMDENGLIPYGYLGDDLLVADPTILGGLRINNTRLLEEVEKIIDQADIIFIDYGDSVRVQRANRMASDKVRTESKKRVLEEASLLMKDIAQMVDVDNTMFMAISPNPNKNMISEGNFALTPILIAERDLSNKLLSSSTTRRPGLVSNFDFAPTILNYFGIEDRSLIGSAITGGENINPRQEALKSEAEFIYIRKYRKVFHWGYIALVMASLLGLYLNRFTGLNRLPKKLLKYLAISSFAVPITMMTLAPIGYRNIILDLIYVFLGAFLLALVFNKIFKSSMKTIAGLAIISSLLILFDAFFIDGLMIISPLGSDAIAGGRFYGIGNDYMGILLGSTVLGLFAIYQDRKPSKKVQFTITALYLGLIIIALSPLVGANMGGSLSAMFVFLLALIFILDRKFSLRKLIIIGLLVLAAVLSLASLDALFNPSPTHAGKAIIALSSGGYSKLLEIIDIKLRQVFWNIAHASWNIVLFLQLGLLIYLLGFKKDSVRKLSREFRILFKGFSTILLGALFIFLFNDTGTIAAALILYNLFIPLGLVLNEIE